MLPLPRIQKEILAVADPAPEADDLAGDVELRASFAEARGFDLSSVKIVMTSAEPVSQANRDKIKCSLGVKLIDNCGMTEADMVGSEDLPGAGFRI